MTRACIVHTRVLREQAEAGSLTIQGTRGNVEDVRSKNVTPPNDAARVGSWPTSLTETSFLDGNVGNSVQALQLQAVTFLVSLSGARSGSESARWFGCRVAFPQFQKWTNRREGMYRCMC